MKRARHQIESELKDSKDDNKILPLVSIITIVYNGADHLAQAIESVINQSYPYIEYIIIDGGSTDGSIDIIKSFENHIDYWISEPDRGISDAFNKGIAIAKGELIGMVNADDWYETDAVESVMRHVDSGADIIYGQLNYWENDKLLNVKGGNHKHLLSGWRGMTLPHPASFITKSLYDAIGGYDIDYMNAMDYQFFLRASKYGARYHKIKKILSNFRSGGVTSSQRMNALQEADRAKRSILGFSKFKAKFQHYLYYLFLKVLGKSLHRLNLNRFK